MYYFAGILTSRVTVVETMRFGYGLSEPGKHRPRGRDEKTLVVVKPDTMSPSRQVGEGDDAREHLTKPR